jgi:glycosyltransferase involved in cell wall biosynthesis
LGRVDEGKGSRVLAECFAEYKRRHPGPLTLVFAGPVSDAPEARDDIVVTGAVDEVTKWGLLRGATAFVSPSAYESFAIVLLEAWAVGTAALVNGRCPVTRDHAEHSNGALTFTDYAEFEVAVDHLVRDDSLRSRLGANGRDYVERHYRWDDLVAAYARFLTVSRG